MTTSAKILGYDELSGALTLLPGDDVGRELAQRQVGEVEICLVDGRELSAEQRRKIFAIINDISTWCGHEPEYIREHLTWVFRGHEDHDHFSLSRRKRDTATVTVAREFIDYLIDFCFEHRVPTKKSLLDQTDDVARYLYTCLEHRKCAICNAPAHVHHVDRVGMGRNREHIVHIGLKAIALCSHHHDEAHIDENELFSKYHVYGIELDRYLVEKLGLGEMPCLKVDT